MGCFEVDNIKECFSVSNVARSCFSIGGSTEELPLALDDVEIKKIVYAGDLAGNIVGYGNAKKPNGTMHPAVFRILLHIDPIMNTFEPIGVFHHVLWLDENDTGATRFECYSQRKSYEGIPPLLLGFSNKTYIIESFNLSIIETLNYSARFQGQSPRMVAMGSASKNKNAFITLNNQGLCNGTLPSDATEIACGVLPDSICIPHYDPDQVVNDMWSKMRDYHTGEEVYWPRKGLLRKSCASNPVSRIDESCADGSTHKGSLSLDVPTTPDYVVVGWRNRYEWSVRDKYVATNHNVGIGNVEDMYWGAATATINISGYDDCKSDWDCHISFRWMLPCESVFGTIKTDIVESHDNHVCVTDWWTRRGFYIYDANSGLGVGGDDNIGADEACFVEEYGCFIRISDPHTLNGTFV